MMYKIKRLPSQRLLTQILRYDAETGKLYWQTRPVWMFSNAGRGGRQRAAKTWNSRLAGAEAMRKGRLRYAHGLIFGRSYKAHRLIWKMHTGEEPDLIDHISGDTSDNRIANLRNVSSVDNSRNSARPANNTSGTIGVYWHKSNCKWIASIIVVGETIHLGNFSKKEDAIAARKAAEIECGFHKNHGRQVS